MTAHLKKRGRIWYIADSRRLISTGTTKKGQAQQILDEYTRKKLGIVQTPRRTVSHYLPGYITYCQAYNKPETVADKARTLRIFAELARDPYIGSVTKNTIERVLNIRREQGLGLERWNKSCDYIGHFFCWLISEKLLAENPCDEVRRQKIVRNKRPKALTDEYISLLLGHLWDRRPQLYRMAIVVLNTGLRVREVANLTWPDVDLRNGMLHVTAKPDWTPKDYEERSIGINADARDVLEAQKAESIGLPYVFPRQDGQKYGRGIDVAMQRAFREVGMKSGGFHSLRHTFATKAVEAGIDPESIRRLMGHSDLKTVLKYLHVRDEHLKKMTDRLNFTTVRQNYDTKGGSGAGKGS